MTVISHVGTVGSGKMGGNMRERVRAQGLTLTGLDPNSEISKDPAPTISAAVSARFVSRQKDSPSMKVVAAFRNQCGGHSDRKN